MIKEFVKNKKIGVLFYDNGTSIATSTFNDFIDVLRKFRCSLNVIKFSNYYDLISEKNMSMIMDSDFICKIVYGEFNRNGIVQGLLTCCGKKSTGHLLKTDLISQDKLLIKQIMKNCGIPTPTSYSVEINNPLNVIFKIASNKRYILKPRYTNTSIGIMSPKDSDELKNSLKKINFDKYGEYYIEEFKEGQVLSIGVMPDLTDGYIITDILEYVYDGLNFMDEKWKSNPKRKIADNIPYDVAKKMKNYALTLHKSISAKCATRTDFIYTTEGEIYVLEINSNIGFSRNHDFPIASRKRMDYEKLVFKYLETAYVEG